jgi:hypothetical protein
LFPKTTTTTKSTAMPAPAPDAFHQNLTHTLRAKGIKNLSELQQHYQSLTQALNTLPPSFEELVGSGGKEEVNRKAKALTLRFGKKRGDGEFKELMGLWKQYETQVPDTHDQQTPEVTPVHAQVSVEVGELKSDQDVAVVLMALIHDEMLAIWSAYDPQFNRESFTVLGQPGWESCPMNGPPREKINHKKNEEVSRLMERADIQVVITKIHEVLVGQVFGVRRREVKQALKNHIRAHLIQLIYGN